MGSAVAAVLDFDAGSNTVLHEDTGHQRLVKEFKLRVFPADVPHHDVGT